MADHAKLDRTFAEFQRQQGHDTVQAKLLFDQFMAGLQGHIIWEEELLFPIFEKRTGMTVGGSAYRRAWMSWPLACSSCWFRTIRKRKTFSTPP